jgi:hypothetical protein
VNVVSEFDPDPEPERKEAGTAVELLPSVRRLISFKWPGSEPNAVPDHPACVGDEPVCVTK